MISEDLKFKLSQVEVAVTFYDELNRKLIRNDVDLENTKLKMIFTKKEILKLIIESKDMIESTAQSIENL